MKSMSLKIFPLLMALCLCISNSTLSATKSKYPTCSLRLALLAFGAISIGTGIYSVGFRDKARVEYRNRIGFELQSVPFEEFENDLAIKEALTDVALHERRYYQSWKPDQFRFTLAYYAKTHDEIGDFVKAKGIPLDDPKAFESYLGLTGPEVKKTETRPLVESPFPGVMKNRSNVDALMALIYWQEIEWARNVGKLESIHYDGIPGNEGKPWNASHSFRSEWYRMGNIKYLVDSELKSTKDTPYLATYLRYRWQTQKKDVGKILRQLFERHPDVVARVRSYQGPGMLPRLVIVQDTERFEALAGGHPYGINDENLDLTDSTLGSILFKYVEASGARDRKITNEELIAEFLKAESLP